MDSFAQQMFNEIERRYKAYHFSSSSISLNEECDTTENENCLKLQQQSTFPSILDDVKNTEFDKSVCNGDGIEQNKPSINEMIYANSHMIRHEVEFSSSNNFVPIGRKPALPPKPPNRPKLNLTRPKELAHKVLISKTNGKSPPNEKDPAEMSVKERSALFEKSFDGNTKKMVPKAPVRMSIPNSGGNVTLHHAPNTAKQIVVHRKPAHCDIINNKESENIATSTALESKYDRMQDATVITEERYGIPKITSQRKDATDSVKRNLLLPKTLPPPPPPPKFGTMRTKDAHNPTEGKLQSQDAKYLNINSYKSHVEPALYGDLTPIVTTIAPAKIKPDETIGLNDLHQSALNCSLLTDNQYQPKEEDKWDRFIECLLFFCCVA